MRIDNAVPLYFHTPPDLSPRHPVTNAPAEPGAFDNPVADVELSPQASDLLAAHGECSTCDSRRYVDQSDDPSVSFQAPTHISPGQSAAAVLSHEREHVVNEQARADREGRRVVSQTVSIQMANCPECNRMYAAGGSTRTVTVNDSDNNDTAQGYGTSPAYPGSTVDLLA